MKYCDCEHSTIIKGICVNCGQEEDPKILVNRLTEIGKHKERGSFGEKKAS